MAPTKRAHDAGFWRAYVEGCAFAWAQEVALLGTPHLVPFDPRGPGEPDLYIEECDLWIEVKTAGLSEQRQVDEDALFDRARTEHFPMVTGTIRQGVPSGLKKKFDDLLSNAEKKFDRRRSTRRLLFVGLAIPFGNDRDEIRSWARDWADRVLQDRGVEVVLCNRTEWREPFHFAKR